MLHFDSNSAELHSNIAVAAVGPVARSDRSLSGSHPGVTLNSAECNNLGNAFLQATVQQDAMDEYQQAVQLDSIFAEIRF